MQNLNHQENYSTNEKPHEETKYFVRVDPDAAACVKLMKKLDNHGNAYFTGKLQIPGDLDFSQGVSFQAFVSEEGMEELEISVMTPEERTRYTEDRSTDLRRILPDRIQVPMKPIHDGGELVFVGGASSPVTMPLTKGIWFILFTKEGREELQISRLKIHRPNLDNKFI